jgi:phosphoribosylamine--glycine ligase
METDLLTAMKACREGTLAETDVRFSDGYACCVVMASDGYPEAYEKGYEITVNGVIDGDIFVAGAKSRDGKLLTNGGRVLGVTATAPTLPEAIEKAYDQVKKVSFGNAYFRHDIGQRALRALEG